MSGGELQRPWTSCPRDNFETEKLKWFKTWNHFAFCVWYKQVGIDWKYLSKFNIELQWFKSSFACLVFIELFISYVNFFFPFISQGAFIKIFISAADRHGCQYIPEKCDRNIDLSQEFMTVYKQLVSLSLMALHQNISQLLTPKYQRTPVVV